MVNFLVYRAGVTLIMVLCTTTTTSCFVALLFYRLIFSALGFSASGWLTFVVAFGANILRYNSCGI